MQYILRFFSKIKYSQKILFLFLYRLIWRNNCVAMWLVQDKQEHWSCTKDIYSENDMSIRWIKRYFCRLCLKRMNEYVYFCKSSNVSFRAVTSLWKWNYQTGGYFLTQSTWNLCIRRIIVLIKILVYIYFYLSINNTKILPQLKVSSFSEMCSH